MRRRDRGGVRAHSGQGGGVEKARRGPEARRAALHEYLGHRHRHHGQCDEAAAGRGRHAFLAPANVMKLFEVVKGEKSAPDTLATAMDLGRKIGKISAMAGNGDGFVANRSRTPFGTEMNIMVEEGALPEQVDKVMVDFGYPIAPFATADLSGLDIGYARPPPPPTPNPPSPTLPTPN